MQNKPTSERLNDLETRVAELEKSVVRLRAKLHPRPPAPAAYNPAAVHPGLNRIWCQTCSETIDVCPESNRGKAGQIPGCYKHPAQPIFDPAIDCPALEPSDR